MRTFLIFLICLVCVLSFANGFERDDDIVFSKKRGKTLKKERIIVKKIKNNERTKPKNEALKTKQVHRYDLSSYATDPLHGKRIRKILNGIGEIHTAEDADEYIKDKAPRSPITGEMVVKAAHTYKVNIRLLLAVMQQDSQFGTQGKGKRTKNPGNVGNTDTGESNYCTSWQEGVNKCAEWLSNNKKLANL